MKLFVKTEYMVIIVIGLLLLFGSFIMYNYKMESINRYNGYVSLINDVCKDGNEKGVCAPDFEIPKELDTFTVFEQSIIGYEQWLIDVIAPIIIIVAVTWNFHKKLHSGFFKYELNRMKYKKIISNNIKRILKISLILPCYAVFIFFLSYCISGHFNLSETLKESPFISTIWEPYRNNILLYYCVYFINLYLQGIFYCNLGIFFAKKNKNIFVSIISSILSFYVIGIITEVVIGRLILYKIFHYNVGDSLNLFTFWSYSGTKSLLFLFCFALALVVISATINYFNYKNKEKVIVATEI